MKRRHSRRQGGQILVIAALAIFFVIVPVVGLVIDGGYALAQRRASQNASDFAALSGARIVSEWISGDTSNGTDANVRTAISAAVRANGGTPITFGAPDGPQYVQPDGTALGYVGGGTIPTNTVGVTVGSARTWRPFFLGSLGIGQWDASARATAKGGYAAGGPPGPVFPVGVAEAFFQTYPFCSGPVSTDPASSCYPIHLTSGNLNVPGGFGWLTFGAAGKCAGFGLGMLIEGCDPNTPFLVEEIGPPANSHGCCTAVSGDPEKDRIGSLPGNKVSEGQVVPACQYYIDNKVTVTVPVWDYAGGTGHADSYYHIIGFAGFQLTKCEGGKDIEGVWRRVIFTGPTTSTEGFPGAPLAVQLVQ
jgi:hypothetical protein